MSPYSPFLDTLNELRKRTSRFRRVALHVHSPDSYDWAKMACNADLNNRDKFLAEKGETLFIDILKQHFNLVAITDHMKCGYACKVSRESQAHYDFIVLPGMEVNIQPEAAVGIVRLHLLVILPEGATPEHISRLFFGLPNIPVDAQRIGNEIITDVSVSDFIKRVHQECGLCIAAHVNSAQGVRHHFRQTSRDIVRLITPGTSGSSETESAISDALKKYIFSVGFDAIEVTKAADKPHYRWFSENDGTVNSIPVVMSFDAHRVEDFDRPERVTWVKMTSLNLKGLRDALIFSDTRVRFLADLPSPPSPRLLGIEIVGSADSLFSSMHVAFAENLNCLIGPRGSGKSTIVEALRYAFGYNNTLSALDVTNKLSDRIRSLQIANLSGCLIRVAYQTVNQEKRIIEATFDPKEDYSSKVFSDTGEFLDVSNIENSGDYPLRLFGWSEIETLGRESAMQRDLLDRLIPELSASILERGEKRKDLRANRKDIEKIIEELSSIYLKKNSIIRRYIEYKTAFDKLNTPAIKVHFVALDLAQGKKRILETVNTNIANMKSQLNEMVNVSFRDGIDDELNEGSQELRDWWSTDEINRLNIPVLEGEVQKYIDAAVKTLVSISDTVSQHITLLDDMSDALL